MTRKEHMNNYFVKRENEFSYKYGLENLNTLKREIFNSKSFMELTIFLGDKYFPVQELIESTVTKIEYINIINYFFGKPSITEQQKKLDYFVMSYQIIVDYWVNNIMQNQNKVIPEHPSMDYNKRTFLLNETGWSTAESLIQSLEERYAELLNEFIT